jgi:hypothetical protein
MGTPERRRKRERSASAGNALDAVSSPARTHRKPEEPQDEHSMFVESCRRIQSPGTASAAEEGLLAEGGAMEFGNAKFMVRPQLARRRSSSCGVIASMMRNGGFSTIPEEELEDVADSEEGGSRRGDSFDSRFGEFEPFDMEEGGER